MRSNVFGGVEPDHALTRLDAVTATTSHRTTSISVVGSYRERRFLLGSWPALQPVSPRESRTTAFPRPKTPSHFSSIGSPLQVRDTVELLSTLRPGLPRKTRVFILLSTFTIWQKRSASYHQLPRPGLQCQLHTTMRKLSSLGFQGEINVDQAHRGYDITVDETGKTWYNPF